MTANRSRTALALALALSLPLSLLAQGERGTVDMPAKAQARQRRSPAIST